MDSFQLTFLGTATSVGIPMIGCQCRTCTSSDPRDQRTRSSIYLESPELSWIVDTGPDFRTQCLREKIARIDAVLFTHAHMDHLLGFDDLRRFTIEDEDELPVYGLESTLQVVQQVFHYSFPPSKRWRGYLKAKAVPITGPFHLGKTEVTPLPVKHGSIESIGYLFSRQGRKLCAYISDMKAPLPGTLELIQGVDILICDALRHSPHPTHMNFDEARQFRELVGPNRTIFTHIQCEITHALEQAKLPPDITLAYDGMKLQWDDLS